MTGRQILLMIVVGLVGLSIGGIAGYLISQERAKESDIQAMDLVRATRAADLQNRLTLLRVVREQKLNAKELRSLETSAVLLLGTIDLDSVSKASESRIVLLNTSKDLAGYRQDFPDSEFDPSKNQAIAKLLSIADK